MDAYDFVTKEPAGRFDAIIIDINFQSDDLSISPPWKFLSLEFFNGLIKHANQERFYISMNVLYYDEETKQKVFAQMTEGLSGKVDNMAYLEVEEGANKVFVFTKDQAKVDLMDYQGNTKQLENVLKAWGVQNKGAWVKDMQMGDLLKTLEKVEKK